jgi:hypothetical protein
MEANARINGQVDYRAGDGPLLRVPQGPCTVEPGADSTVLSWEEEGKAMSAAIPRADYDRFVKEGRIVLRGG